MNCLDVEFLKALLVCGKSSLWPILPEPINYRHHFHVQLSKILGWRKRTPFCDHINRLIREELWLEDANTDGDQKGKPSGCSSPICTAKPKNSLQCEGTPGEGCKETMHVVREGASGVAKTIVVLPKWRKWYTKSSTS